MPDMKELTLSTQVNCRIDVVFDLLIDPAHSPDWIDSFKRETATPWPPRIGTRYRHTDWSGERSEYKVDAFKAPSLFGLVSKDGNYHVEYVLSSPSKTTTKINYHEWTDIGDLGADYMEEALAKFKKILET
jgi:hypothetical protein